MGYTEEQIERECKRDVKKERVREIDREGHCVMHRLRKMEIE